MHATDTKLFLGLVSSAPTENANVLIDSTSPTLVLGLPLFPLQLMAPTPSCVLWPSVWLAAFALACRFVTMGTPVLVALHTNLDRHGDHAVCCTKTGDLIVRHNRIRDLVDKIAREGQLSPILEKKGILGESAVPGRRPGDVTIPLWCEGKGLCVDVGITCPFAHGNLLRDSPCEYFAESLKHRKYDSDFMEQTTTFAR